MSDAHETATQSDRLAYALALGHERIAWFAQDQAGTWHREDHVDIKGLSQDEVQSRLQPLAEKWRAQSTKVDIWLPRDIAIKKHSTVPLSVHEVHYHIAPDTQARADELIVVRAENTRYDYYLLEREHIELTLSFVEDAKFEIFRIGLADVIDDHAEPILFSAKAIHKETDAQANAEGVTAPKVTINSASVSKFSGLGLRAPVRTGPDIPYGLIGAGLGALLLLCALIYLIMRIFFGGDDAPETASVDATTEPTQEQAAIAEPSESAPVETPAPEPAPTTPAATEAPEPVAEPTEESDSTTPPETEEAAPSEEEEVETLPDEAVQPLPFSVPARPEDQGELSELLGDNVEVVIALPSFRVTERPETHADDIADLASSPASFIRPEPGSGLLVLSPDSVTSSEEVSNQNDIVLLGIAGARARPHAVVQSREGIASVNVGDTVQGWKIEAISASEVIVRNGDEQVSLTVPEG